jgi:CO/xanthine dehydrogenase FAD-binding subunit
MITADVDQTITVVPGTDGAIARLAIPAGSSLQALYEHTASPHIVRRTLSLSLSWQERVEKTVAQVLLSPGLAPGWIAALLAAEARAIYGRNGAEEALLATLLYTRGIQGKELQSLQLPLDSRWRWGEAHVARMLADQPLVTAVTTVAIDGGLVRHARLALTGVWHQHARLASASGLLTDQPLDSEHIGVVAQAVGREVKPDGDFLASVAYRRAMAVVLTRRVLLQCQHEQGEREG